VAPTHNPQGLTPQDIIARLRGRFAHVSVDWQEGERWLNARIAKAIEIGNQKILIDADIALRGKVALVTVATDPQEPTVRVQFYLSPESDSCQTTDSIELHYSPGNASRAARVIAKQIGEAIDFDIELYDG
jgi:hypothetical protein